jgi:transposase
MKIYYIGADVHSNSTELAIEHKGEIVSRYSVPTTIPAIRNVLSSISGEKHLTMEEGPMAGWLYRNLNDAVNEFIICDPYRNKLICSDGDADDRIDAGKLASLLRGGFLRSVYHNDDENRVILKEWVCLYLDRVRDAVRMVNKIRARCRMNGISIPRAVICEPSKRKNWLSEIHNTALAAQLNMLWLSYDSVVKQVKISKRQLAVLSRQHNIIKLWSELPGIGIIRAITLFAFLDTPWRFKKKNKLWKYCGVGLERSASGTDKNGKPKPAFLQLAWRVNKVLKYTVLGAALSAINQNKNIFSCYYERMTNEGIMPSNARHSVARKMLTVMSGMWKQNGRFNKNMAMPVSKSSAVSPARGKWKTLS